MRRRRSEKSASKNDMTIHIARDGEVLGIFSQEELNAALSAGSVLPSDFAWREGMTDWEAVNEVVRALNAPESVTAAAVDAEIRHEEIAHLHEIPTSPTLHIPGRNLIQKIKFVKVQGFTREKEAQIEFLHKVVRAGGNGVIEMKVRRDRKGYFSVQGEAVEVE